MATQEEIIEQNKRAAVAQAALDAKRAASRKRVAAGTSTPAPQPHVETPETGTGNAMLAALMARLDKLEAENAELKAGKGAAKGEKKPAEPTCKNCTYTYDQKTGKLVVTFDLSSDIIDPETGAPKLSNTIDLKTGRPKTSAVAMFQGNFEDKNGRKVGISANAYHKLDK